MSDEKTVPKRDQVLALLKEGKYTREQIAVQLGMSTASVSSQFTYLRWMGNYIIADENKILSLATETEFSAWEAARESNRKTKTTTSAASTKTPAEQYESAKKAIETSTKQLASWKDKLDQANKDLLVEPDNTLLIELQAEAGAMVTLLTIKLRRQQAKFETMEVPAPVVVEEDAEVSSDELLDEENDENGDVVDDNDLV